MSRKFRTKVITDESQVPAGFRRISALADSITDQKKLSDAHTDGLIEAVKLMRSTDDRTGPVWVDAVAADRVLRGEEKPKEGSKSSGATGIDKRHVESVCESLADISSDVGTLHQILSVLERLTAAVESIATQPKRDPLEEFANDNGFHDTLSRPAH